MYDFLPYLNHCISQTEQHGVTLIVGECDEHP